MSPAFFIPRKETMNITLYYREGSSDKVYRAAIEPKGEGYVVNFAYGRRSSQISALNSPRFSLGQLTLGTLLSPPYPASWIKVGTTTRIAVPHLTLFKSVEEFFLGEGM